MEYFLLCITCEFYHPPLYYYENNSWIQSIKIFLSIAQSEILAFFVIREKQEKFNEIMIR